MTSLSRHLTGPPSSLLVGIAALLVSACGTEIIFEGSGGSGASNTGGNNTGASNTGAGNVGGSGNSGGINTGGNNVGGSNTGAGSGVDCVNAESGDYCGSPGSYCSYYDAGTGEYCDAWCTENLRWEKSCYIEPTYCYEPSACPAQIPQDQTFCPTIPDCDVYECNYDNVCGGSGYGYASCQDGVWYAYQDCYCYQPPNLCPASPPQNGTPCTVTQQCQQYDCEWQNACGNGTFHYAYCDGGFWYSDGDCN